MAYYVERLLPAASRVVDSEPKVKVLPRASWLAFLWVVARLSWEHRGGRSCSSNCRCSDFT